MCACAVDIGTTTVAAVLADLTTGRLLAKASSGNGQIRYGADVINRIIEQSKPGGVKKLQDAVHPRDAGAHRGRDVPLGGRQGPAHSARERPPPTRR
jgi:hypothetical protein